MIRVGLLGAGSIAAIHSEAYQEIEGARVVAVADVNHAAADRLAQEHQARAYYEIESLLEDRRVDMVDVCLPTFLHERTVVRAAEARKHVLCEKPIGRSLEEVDRMITAVRQAGVHAMVAQSTRFWPQFVVIKELLDLGELGRPLMATATRLSIPKWGWFKDPQLSGGALLDLLVHDLDYFFHIFGKPQSVYAVGLTSETGAWDEVVAVLDYVDKKAIAEASYLMPARFPFVMSFRLLGDRGYVEYRHQGELLEQTVPETRFVLYLAGKPPASLPCSDRDGYAGEIEYFVNCLVQDKPPEIATLEEARTVLQIALAAERSLEIGQVVAL